MGVRKKTPTNVVRCPRCGRPQPKRGADALYWCTYCRGVFDNDPNEGGDWSDRDPSARLEREERRREGCRS